MNSPRYCESCGRKASDDARFCGGCGRPFGASAAAGPPGDGSRAAGAPGPGDESEQAVAEIRPVSVRTILELLLCVLTAGLVWGWLAICRRRVRYRITSQRIEIVSGLVTVTRRTIELFRVQDFEVVQPFFLRVRGAGNLVVRSQDPGEGEFVLTAIPNVAQVHETLRSLVNAERRRMHVRVVEENR
jgi:hypothetical protein